jgi:alpha-ketoglutarate-dependent taurine dioxygenase
MKPPTLVDSPEGLSRVLAEDGAVLFPIGTRRLEMRLREVAAELGTPLGHKHADATTQIVNIRADGAYDAVRRPQSSPTRQSAHTDGAFLDVPPSIVAMCGVHTAAHGGESVLVHGRDLLIEALSLIGPEALSALFDPDCYRVHRGATSIVRPALIPSCDGRGIQIAFGAHEFNQVDVRAEARLPFELLSGLRRRADLEQHLLLRPGYALFVLNHTVLHGREAWYDSDCDKRHVVRLWMSAHLDSPAARASGVDVAGGSRDLELLMMYGLQRVADRQEAVQ